MNENRVEHKEEMEIDVQRLLGTIWQKKWLIAFVSAACAVLFLLGTMFLITPQYESSAMFYVNNSSLSVGDATFSIESGDISAAKSLVNSYIVILQTRESLNDVIDYAGVNRTYEELKKMITAAAVNSTEIFEVVVTSPDPNEAEQIADAIAYILPKRISNIIEGTSAKVVDSAVVAVKPSSPSYSMNTVIGLVIGFILSVAVVVLWELFDITIRAEEDITQSCRHPILAAVPDMAAPSKGGYYSPKNAPKPGLAHGKQQTAVVGKDISFAASEAYKLLRTKLQFSFADDNGCRVVGVSSALSGEGKSLSSVNLAYALSELNKKVLLIDCDMRRPSLADKIPIRKVPGLSDYLSAQCAKEEIFQPCQIVGDEDAFTVVSAGRNPPNPVELLSSPKMARMLEKLRSDYDYIILDLPPVGEVSDALAVAKLTDGMLLVVRQDHGNRIAFSSAVRQFEFIESKILGIVYNCASENTGAYSKKYYKQYADAYAASAEKAKAKSGKTGGK